MIYDVIIIGAGPAGISAAIYAKRSGLKTLVFESKMLGGLINYTNVVDNYPGFTHVSGPELAGKMYDHFMSLDIEYKNENVSDVIDGDVKKVITSSGEYSTKNVIIATGRARRSLNVPGEKELSGKGISYCAMCDGHFYKDKDVLVVGGGDSSLEETLYLSKLVRHATILIRGNKLAGNSSLIEKIEKCDNVKVEYGVTISELLSKGGIMTGAKLNDGRVLDAQGVFVYIGFDPVLPFATDLEIERDKGYIVVNENFETSKKGIYAVGDIIKKSMYQIISAEYEGAVAAVHIAASIDKEK